MFSFVAAISNASTSGVNLAYAFLDPSGLSKTISERAPSSVPSSPQDIPNQRINLHALHIIQFLQRLLDLPLVRLDIANENQRVILLNLLHRTLGIQRVDDDFVVV